MRKKFMTKLLEEVYGKLDGACFCPDLRSLFLDRKFLTNFRQSYIIYSIWGFRNNCIMHGNLINLRMSMEPILQLLPYGNAGLSINIQRRTSLMKSRLLSIATAFTLLLGL